MNKQAWIDYGLKIGLDEVEIYDTNTRRLTISLFNAEVDSYGIANDQDYLVKVVLNKKMVSAHLTSLDDEMIKEVLNDLKENVLSIESDDEVSFYQGDENYPEFKKRSNVFKNKTYEEKVNILKELESYTLKKDQRINQVMGIEYEEVYTKTAIINSKGLNITKEDDYSLITLQVLASENDDKKSEYKIDFIVDNDFDYQKFADEIIKGVTNKLNAKSIKSDAYPVIMDKKAMRSLLGALSGMYFGENVYKGVSILKDKLNTKIFSDLITITDNAIMDNSFNSLQFDSEGVAGRNKVLVENGILKSYLHNLKSAKMMNTNSTGNASGITNFSIQNGSSSYDELLKLANNGIIINDISGLHAGLNTLTTDFSLLASGFEIKDGKILRPINLITVAGNYMEMMKEVIAVGDDLEYSVSGVGSPSILFKKLNISGE